MRTVPSVLRAPAFTFSLAAVVGLAGLLVGCGPGWTVIKASGPPSAIKGATSFAVAGDFSGVMIGKKTEAEYLSEKDADTKASFAGDKVAMHAEVLGRFVARSPGLTIAEATGSESAPGGVLVTVIYKSIEPGTFAVVYNAPTVVVARVVFSRDGAVVDEIELKVAWEANSSFASSGSRMRKCAELIGAKIASFVSRANEAK